MNGCQGNSFHHQSIQSFPPNTIKDYSTLLGTQFTIPARKSKRIILGKSILRRLFIVSIFIKQFHLCIRERSFSIRFPGGGSFTVPTSFLQRLKGRMGKWESFSLLKQHQGVKPSLEWKVVNKFCPLALLSPQKELF